MSNRATSPESGTVRGLVDALGPWSEGPGPLFRQLARSIAGAIERGAVAHDARLPSERSLAEALAIGRGTAVAAYDVLVGEGLLQRRRGSGTYVDVVDPLLVPAGRHGSALVHRLVDRSGARSDVIDLSLSVLRDAAGLPPVAVGTADLLSVVPDTGYTPWSLPSLRRT